VSDHLSRKELKQDKIKESIEHGAEAVFSHSQLTLAVLVVILIVASSYGGWRIYTDRQTVQASASFDAAMKVYSARIAGTPDAAEPNEPVYSDEQARAQDASVKFTAVADKYPGTNPGRLARYYAALCFEDLDRQNQALEELKKLSASSDKEMVAMAQYQTAVLYSRTGKPNDAIKIYRALADKPSVMVTKPLVLLELASVLRQTSPSEAATIYRQITKDYPDTAISEQAQQGLDLLAPPS
jgi:predicted negative regulator of RcsB-dependent stress response